MSSTQTPKAAAWLLTDQANYVRSFLAEFVGTAILVLFTCGTCVATSGKGDSLVSTALSFGLTVTCLVACLGHVSGCHINPAVTVGMLVNGQCSPIRAVIYIVAQLLGGVAGAAILQGLLVGSSNLCATVLHVSIVQGVLVEAFICFLLILVICNVCESNQNLAPVIIGLAVTAGHLFAVSFPLSSLNYPTDRCLVLAETFEHLRVSEYA